MNALILLALIALLVANVRAASVIRTRLNQFMRGRSAVFETSDVHQLLEDELERARRLQYSLSLISIRPDGRNASTDRLLKHVDDEPEPVGFYSARSVNLFRNAHKPIIQLRSTDIAVYDRQQHRLFVLLLGTARADAEKIAERISKAIAATLRAPVSFGCAEFPADNFFIEDLIENARAAGQRAEYPGADEQFPGVAKHPDVETA